MDPGERCGTCFSAGESSPGTQQRAHRAFPAAVRQCDNRAVTLSETFVRVGVIAASFGLCGAVVTGCSSPPRLNVKLTFPSHAASPATSPSDAATPAPSPGTFSTPANFQADPGFELTSSGQLEFAGTGGSSDQAAFECCVGHDWSSSAADPQTWSPDEQVRITWIETAAASNAEATMFLSAKMYGSFSTVSDARNYSPDNPVVTAAVVRWDTEVTGSATSVITIPADAAPGYYELQFSAAAHEVGGCATAACAPGFYDGAIIQVR